MSIAITDDHRVLAATARDLLIRHNARGAARALLEAEDERLPVFWPEITRVGWLGLHLPEKHGGSDFGLPELVVVVEELGRAIAPGPFVPAVLASAIIASAGDRNQQAKYLPGLADGSLVGAVAFGDTVLSGGLADLILVVDGEDLHILDSRTASVTVPPNLDPTRRTARLRRNGATGEVLPGAARMALAMARTILSAEAVGVASECVDSSVAYAKEREQFGRPIGTFQAVKHHCANMLVSTELATAAVWDAARAAASGGPQFELAAATAAALAMPAAYTNAQLNVQVHGGIGYTWEHDAHLLERRATAIGAVIDSATAATDIIAAATQGVTRELSLDLPAEAEAVRVVVRAAVAELAPLDPDVQRRRLVESGYAVPEWPRPWGRSAGALEQLVINEEFAAADIHRPQYMITGWIVLTLTQYGTPEQIARWVRPALDQDEIWCQLFSEPGAGSDAASIRTRATRVEGGWIVNGQKVWTSGAHVSRYGLATVRTDPEAPKHKGITTMVIDMHAAGVEVRPLRQATGESDFNEVFLTEVFVPDTDVVGEPHRGWAVARATLGNERLSIGEGAVEQRGPDVLAELAEHGDRLPGAGARIGGFLAVQHALRLLNLRAAQRAVAGTEPGPEGNVSKLVLAEHGHEHAVISAALAGPEAAFLGDHSSAAHLVLFNRAMSVAGGTSEITRNQIAERILGLPRDPLIR